ncbi:Uncharacterised protein (plasmid) [Legionella adelaidensis]|uniref:Uncharacterized protein n=1 Tax=Legionella adelaidensis TaxID=45056 RepID=A0A0W0R457_9GAMM|nr:hypothetical protein [Legionella adelaidensis]KTC65835.1 hypothetical protein Lade_0493 [Legionella adelaidensis]VEH85265.1 Uncharacterised protein [Legionella adelaidensis]
MFSPGFAPTFHKNHPIKERSRAAGFSVEDQERLVQLKAAYCEQPGYGAPPDSWGLDEKHRPIYFSSSSNFAHFSVALQGEILAINIKPAPICHALRGVFNTLAKLFDSLSKRTEGSIRAGGVEEMFFTHLVTMLIQLSAKQFNEASTLQEIETLISYCEKVKTTILKPESSERLARRNNPISALNEVILNLKAIKEVSQGLCQTNFQYNLTQLDNSISHMSAQVFKIMYLMCRSESFTLELEVIPFIDMTQTHRPAISELRRKRLPHWLMQALIAAGVSGNDYRSSIASLSLEQIDHFLEGECPGDLPCTLPPALQDPTNQEWGYWEITLADSGEMASRLNNIRNVYRSILRVYNLHAMLSQCKTIGAAYGEHWLFMSPEGRQITETLVYVANKTFEEFTRSFDLVWTAFYESIQAKKAAGAIKSGDKVLSAFDKAFAQRKDFGKYQLEFSEAADGLTQRLADIRLTTVEFYRTNALPNSLMEFVQYFSGEKRERLPIDRGISHIVEMPAQAVDEEQAPKRVDSEDTTARIPTAPPFISLPMGKPTGFNSLLERKLNKSEFPFTQVAAALFSTDRKGSLPSSVRASLAIDDVIISPQTPFRDPLHRLVYEKFLLPNKTSVKRHNIFSIWWIPSESMPQFRRFYESVNTLLKYIYAPNPPKHISDEHYFLDMQMVNHYLLQAMVYYYQYYWESEDFEFCEQLIRDSVLQFQIMGEDSIILSMSRANSENLLTENTERADEVRNLPFYSTAPQPFGTPRKASVTGQMPPMGTPRKASSASDKAPPIITSPR